MAILSKRMIEAIESGYRQAAGTGVVTFDVMGRAVPPDLISGIAGIRQRRDFAVQESLDLGEPAFYEVAPGLVGWAVALENRRILRGGIGAGPVFLSEDARNGAAESLEFAGMDRREAEHFVAQCPVWHESRMRDAAVVLEDLAYRVTGWAPELMRENRLMLQRRRQSRQAAEERDRRSGKAPIYAFEKERRLLANIRVGNLTGAREILNDMLADIYLSSPRIPVLRARTIELVSCLTRAAIEDNPLLEPLIERNHMWIERLIHAESFEALSVVLMEALDDFVEAINLHGVNRTNEHVRRALDCVRERCAEPLKVADVAASVGLSQSRLQHLVKEHTGRTLLEIVLERRVRRAEQLLLKTQKSCAEIAAESGFCDQSYFTRQFRRLTGTTPALYRKGEPAVGRLRSQAGRSRSRS